MGSSEFSILLKFLPGFETDIRIVLRERDAGRVAARGNGLELLFQEAAQQSDAFVARGEALLGMEGDRALAGLGFVVARMALVLFGRELVPGLARHARAEARELALLGDAP